MRGRPLSRALYMFSRYMAAQAKSMEGVFSFSAYQECAAAHPKVYALSHGRYHQADHRADGHP